MIPLVTFCFAVVLFVGQAITTSSIAPGDEQFELCGELRAAGIAPIPAYTDNMRVLMDSWNYQNLLPPRSGAVWNQVDDDMNNPSRITTNWIQNSNHPCQQTVQVCGFRAGPQDNWLITQLINRTVNGTRLPQVSVYIQFHDSCDIASNCQGTLSIHKYETSYMDAAKARKVDNYQLVERISLAGTRENETHRSTVTFNSSHSLFYLALRDENSCIIASRLIVFYYVCPYTAKMESLIRLPETLAPPFPCSDEEVAMDPFTVVNATCVDNAEPENEQPPKFACSSVGVWDSVTEIDCHCVHGHYHNDSGPGACIPCPAGTYLSPSNNSCSICPANSVSKEEGLAQCTCIEGYYRATQGEDLPCTYQDSTKSFVNGSFNSEMTVIPNSTLATSCSTCGCTDEEVLKNDPNVLLASTIPLVLFCVALLMVLITLTLLYSRARKDNSIRNTNNHDNDPKVSQDEEEVYYNVIDISKHEVNINLQALTMEKNCAYGNINNL